LLADVRYWPLADIASFNANLSGWGLDFVWPTQVADWTRLAIVDAVAVCHTRPIGGPNYRHLAAAGKSPYQEMSELLANYGLTQTERPIVRGGIDKLNRCLSMYDSTARELIDTILIGYLADVGKYPEALTALVRPNIDRVAATDPNVSR
jgi:hypothetical protein